MTMRAWVVAPDGPSGVGPVGPLRRRAAAGVVALRARLGRGGRVVFRLR